MYRILHIALLPFSILLLTSTEASVYEQHQCPNHPEIVPGLNAELTTRAAQDRFSGAVLISRQGKTLFRNVYGEMNRERNIQNTPNTRFRFGSLGKMFTGVAIMQLVQAGAVQLDDPISVYLASYPNPDVAKVTIHQLLTHTGGTGDIYGPAFQEHRLELKELSDYVALYGMRGTLFPPGSRHEYSNYGYILLGRVIEETSGLTYEEYVRRNIFQPVGMHSTGNKPESDRIARLALPYTFAAPPSSAPDTSHVLRPAVDFLPYRGNSAGGGYSTLQDLERFVEGLTSYKLLQPYYTELYLKGKVYTPKPGTMYAYGIEDGVTPEGMRFHGHSGGAPGMNASLYFYPSSGHVVVILANMDPPAADEIQRFIGARLEL